MEESIMTSRAAAGDLDAFGELYDANIDAVYDFAWRSLRNTDQAAAAVRETFARSAEDPALLARAPTVRASLLALAHEVVLARAAIAATPGAEPAYEEAFGAFDVPDPARFDASAPVADSELPPLAWEAARELSARDYALLDLNVRKGLSPAELAPVLGVSARQAGQIVQRMRKAAATVLGGYMVARRCRNCEDLRHLLAGFEFPPYGDDVRQAVDAHITTCEACSAEFRALGDPLAAFAALTPLPVPLSLKADTWRDVAAMWPVRDRAQPLAVGAVPTSPDFGAPPAFAGFGGRGDGGGADGSVLLGPSDDSGNRLLLFAVAVLGLVVFAFAVAAGVLIAGGIGDDDDGGVAGDATATVTGTPASTRTVGVNVETSTPEPVTDTPVPPPTDTPAPATATPPPLPTDTPPPPPTAAPTEDEDATPTPEEDEAEATPTP